MQPTISLYIGRTLTGSEAAFLSQLVRDLRQRGAGAVILANFEVSGKAGSRQVDFVAVTACRAQLLEQKELRGPIQATANGRWKLQDRKGKWGYLDRVENPIEQVIATKNALNDALERFQKLSGGKVPAPLKGKFYKQIDAVVSIWPLLDPVSSIEANSFKARVLGYSDGVQALVNDQMDSSWSLNDWATFADHLNLNKVSLEEAISSVVFEARARLDAYRSRFVECFAPGLPAMFDIQDDENAGSKLVERLLKDSHTSLIGPSGTTKSFHMNHAALSVAKRGSVPIFLRPVGRWRDFKHLLHSGIGAYSNLLPEDFLRDIKDSHADLHVFVDGLNEFDATSSTLLLEGLLWLQGAHNARVVISSTKENSLPEALQGVEVRLTSLSKEHKTELFSRYSGQAGPLVEAFLEPLQNAFDIVIAAQATGRAVEAGMSARYERFVRERLPQQDQTVSAALLRSVASYMAEEAYSALPLDEFERLLEIELERQGAPLTVIDALKTSPLMSIRDNAIQFKHERLLRFFQAEAVRRLHEGPDALVKALLRPVCHEIAGFVIERLSGATLKHVLNEVADVPLLGAILQGLWGASAKKAVEVDMSRVLIELAAELPAIAIEWRTFQPENSRSITTLHALKGAKPWTSYEHRLLRLAGAQFGGSSRDAEIFNILQQANGHFTSLTRKAALDAKLNYRHLISEFIRVAMVLQHGNDDDPFTSLVSGIHAGGLTWNRTRAKQLYAALAINGHGNTASVIIMFLMLEVMHLLEVTESTSDEYLALIEAGWNTGIHAIRVSALHVAQSCSLHAHSSPAFSAKLVGLLDQMDSKDLLINSTLNEIKANLGALTLDITTDDAHEEFRKLISARPEDLAELARESGGTKTPEQYLAEFSMGAISRMFEDVFQNVYWEAYDRLSNEEQIAVLCRASGVEEGFFLDWVVTEIVKKQSSATIEALAAKCSKINFQSVFRQDAVGAYLIALAGHAMLAEYEPGWAMTASPDNDAWRLLGLIWWYQFRSQSKENSEACLGLWATLIAEVPLQAVEVIAEMHREYALRKESFTKEVSLLERFPNEYKQLFEHALVNRASLSPGLGGFRVSGTEFVIRLLGAVGTSDTIELIRPLVEDGEVGKAALDSISQIRNRISS